MRVRALGHLYGAVTLATILSACPLHSRAAPQATTTALTITSGSTTVASGGSAASGSVITLTAAVAAGSTKLTTGRVNFCDASVAYCTDIHLLGTGQLTAAGTATLKLRPGIGSHSYKAVFAGTPGGTPAYAASASAATTLSITGTFPTTTAIAASGTAGDYSLAATVTGLVNSANLPAPAATVSILDISNNNAVLATPGLGGAVLAPALVNASNPQTGNLPSGIVTGDLNGDGNLDLAVGVSTASQTVSILLGDGTGNFNAVTTNPITATGSPAAVQDFNGDGIPDLLLTDQLNGSITILLGKGDGTFTVAPGSPIFTNYGVFPIVVADFNGDGIPDIAAAGGYYLVVLLGNGNGSFTQVPIGPSSIPQAELFNSIVVGDFNGDGIPDLAILDTTFEQTVSIFLGNGDGTFRQGTPITLSTANGGGSLASLAMGDFNGDGKLDLAVPVFANVVGNGNSLAILLGNGDGTFQAASTFPVTVAAVPFLSAVGDFNGDGIADLFLGAQVNGQTLNILLGKGDGTFSQMPTGTAQIPCCSNAVVGDFNNDGMTDIASSSFYYSSAEVLLAQLAQTATATATGIAPPGTGIHQVEASYAGNSIYSSSVSATTGLTATGFAISGTAVTVVAGATTGNTSTITLTPSGGFTGAVALTAAITSSPAGTVNPPTFSFGATSPVNITGASAGTATMTIATSAEGGCVASNGNEQELHWSVPGGAALAVLMLTAVPRRRRWKGWFALTVLLAAFGAGLCACGSNTSKAACNAITPPTTSGIYTITVTGTSGATAFSGTVTLTVQ